MCNPVQEISNAADTVVDTVKDFGSSIDDTILQPIIDNPVEAAALITAAIVAPQLLASASFAPEAALLTEAGGMAGAEGLVGAGGLGTGLGATEGTALGTGLSAGATGVGLTAPMAPSLPSMGGATGLLAPAAENAGIIGATGLTAAGALPVLGEASSIINNPAVLGAPVMESAATPSAISLNDAFRAARLANTLMSGQRSPYIPNMLAQAQQPNYTGVDYSAIMNLLASQRPQRFSLLG